MFEANLNRRRFLVAATAALGAAGIASCAPSTKTSRGKSIDEFRAVLQGYGEGEGMDPHKNSLFIDTARLRAVYEKLYEFDDQMRPVPRLAESAQPNADGTKWEVKLRDVSWHDGSKLTSQDVLYSIARILGPSEGKAFYAKANLAIINLAECRTINDRTLEIALHTPSFDFLLNLGAFAVYIVKEGTTQLTTEHVGTGPFAFASFAAGKSMTATAFDDYWDGKPHVAKLHIMSADGTARESAISSGQVDFVADMEASFIKTAAADTSLKAYTTEHSGAQFLVMKTNRPPFDKPDVRRAFQSLIDRDELVKVALQGQGTVENDVFGSTFAYHAEGLEKHVYDPDLAKSLLKKAGAESLQFGLYTSEAGAGFVQAANLIAEQAKAAGVKVDVTVGSKDTYYSDVAKTGDVSQARSGPMPIPNHFASRLTSNAPQNSSKWADPQFDALYAKAQATKDESARTKVYQDMQAIMHDRGGLVVWADSYWTNVARASYKNIPQGVPSSLDWARFDRVSG